MSLRTRVLTLALALSLGFGLLLSGLMLWRGFDDSLAAERARGMSESGMFSATLAAGLEAFSALKQEDFAVRAARTAQRYMVGSALFALLGPDGETLYTNNPEEATPLDALAPETPGMDRLVMDAGREWQAIRMQVAPDSGETQLLYARDISAVYAAARAQARDASLLLLLLYGVLFLVLAWLLRASFHPLHQLAQASGRIAQGDYSARAAIHKPGDEVGQTALRFNQMAQATQAHIAQLEQRDLAQKQFIADMAHELKTPLTSVIGYADLLARHDLPEAQRQKALGSILSQSERLERMAFKLLRLARLEDGEALDLKPVSAAWLFNQARETMEASLQEHRLELQTEEHGEYWVCDADLMLSVLQNLLSNAIFASRPGKRIWLSAQTEGFCVRDEGEGIPAEHLPHVKEAFYMADKSRSRSRQGAGLGLTLCARAAQLHQAELMIDSQEGQGTTVRFLFTKP